MKLSCCTNGVLDETYVSFLLSKIVCRNGECFDFDKDNLQLNDEIFYSLYGVTEYGESMAVHDFDVFDGFENLGLTYFVAKAIADYYQKPLSLCCRTLGKLYNIQYDENEIEYVLQTCLTLSQAEIELSREINRGAYNAYIVEIN